MTTVGEGAAFSLAVLHHFGDAGDMPIGSLVWAVHAISTVGIPVAVTIVSCIAAFLVATPRPERGPANRPAVLEYASPGGPSGSGRPRQGGPLRPIDRFFRVTFADERGFRLWTERVVEFTSALQDIVPELHEIRPVIFVPLMVQRDIPPQAYVSAGARGLAAQISSGLRVDPAAVAMSELPDGLTMLYGEGVDAEAYERRRG